MHAPSAVAAEAQSVPPARELLKPWPRIPADAPASPLALTSRVGYLVGNQLPELPDAVLLAEMSTGTARIELQYIVGGTAAMLDRRLFPSVTTQGETATVDNGIPVSPGDLRALANCMTALADRVEQELPAMEQRIATFAEVVASFLPTEDAEE